MERNNRMKRIMSLDALREFEILWVISMKRVEVLMASRLIESEEIIQKIVFGVIEYLKNNFSVVRSLQHCLSSKEFFTIF